MVALYYDELEKNQINNKFAKKNNRNNKKINRVLHTTERYYS